MIKKKKKTPLIMFVKLVQLPKLIKNSFTATNTIITFFSQDTCKFNSSKSSCSECDYSQFYNTSTELSTVFLLLICIYVFVDIGH